MAKQKLKELIIKVNTEGAKEAKESLGSLDNVIDSIVNSSAILNTSINNVNKKINGMKGAIDNVHTILYAL